MNNALSFYCSGCRFPIHLKKEKVKELFSDGCYLVELKHDCGGEHFLFYDGPIYNRKYHVIPKNEETEKYAMEFTRAERSVLCVKDWEF